MPAWFWKSHMSKYIIWIVALLAPLYATAGSINTAVVEDTWLQRNNDLRKNLNLLPYEIDARLSATAQEWSNLSADRDTIDHKRLATDGYYNYRWIENRFLDRWIAFKNINRATFSESLGYGYFSCKKDDCTADLVNAVKSTWKFYMGEQIKKGPHYKALVHPYFKTMGLGVTVDAAAKRYYLTVHYASEVVAVGDQKTVHSVQTTKAIKTITSIRNPITRKRSMVPIQ